MGLACLFLNEKCPFSLRSALLISIRKARPKMLQYALHELEILYCLATALLCIYSSNEVYNILIILFVLVIDLFILF